MQNICSVDISCKLFSYIIYTHTTAYKHTLRCITFFNWYCGYNNTFIFTLILYVDQLFFIDKYV